MSVVLERPTAEIESKTNMASFFIVRSYVDKSSNLNKFRDKSFIDPDDTCDLHKIKLRDSIMTSMEYPSWFSRIVDLSLNNITSRRSKIETFKAFSKESINDIKKILEVVRLNELDESFIVTLGMASISVKDIIPEVRFAFCKKATSELRKRGVVDNSINEVFK